ncbi:MAG: SlyX family protein [Steroidobacteraceae bacterium]|jgi:uncharacterized coiled-coil protein SlyX|nr:SlyX family protein [Steroidobacteraceae bacterium]
MSGDSRLETLEFRLTHLERAVQELSDVLYRQQQLLDAMSARHERLLERVEAAERKGEDPPAFEIPPHY